MIKRSYCFLFLLSMLLILLLGVSAETSRTDNTPSNATEWNGNFTEGWEQFDKLLEEQKHEAASSLIEKILEEARSEKNNSEWTRCLVRYSSLRISLHGFETAVRFLKDQPWPEDPMSTSILNLFYAQSLVTYARSYSWEINQREKVDSDGTVDLKAWTRNQIYEEAQKAFNSVWENHNLFGNYTPTEWKDFITPNTYPEGIRPTLRDAVSYIWVETLSDTNSWQPEQFNEIYRLNLQELAGDFNDDIPLADPDIHPLKKIGFILADLEKWHLTENNREAALEARLERYRHLHRHFTEDADRQYIQNHLENHLKQLADVPWWSEGMAQLAEFVRETDEPDSLVRAHGIALSGKEAYPESAGGRHCLAIFDQIETPHYSLSGMQNDNAKKRSILITHKNLDGIYLRAYPIDLIRTIEESDDYNLLPSGEELQSLIVGSDPSHSWDISLPPTPDYQTHKTFIVPPMTAPATYLVVASARPGFPQADNRLQAIYLTISDLALISRHKKNGLEVTVLSGSTGKPVYGAEVALYRANYRDGHQKVYTKLTDRQGLVVFNISGIDANYFLVAQKGDQITYGSRARYYPPGEPVRQSATMLYTDRSIYRPGQKILWKAVVYGSDSNGIDFRTLPSSTVTIHLKDQNGEAVESKILTTNNYGTASGEFLIPAGRALGAWRLESSRNGSRMVRIEEYKRPTFEAELLDPEEPLRLNKPAKIIGNATYYFGLPVTNGTILWSVQRDPVYPVWWWRYGQIFNSPSSQSQVIAGGTEALEEDGTFSISFLPEADERLAGHKGVSYRYAVSVDITDEGGETRSASRSFQLGFISIKASTNLNRGFFREGIPLTIDILRTDLDSIPKNGEGLWRIVALKEPEQTLMPADQPVFIPEEFRSEDTYRTPGDAQGERWFQNYNPDTILAQWEDGDAQESGFVFHNDSGMGAVSIDGLAAGAYRLIYKTIDNFGEEYELRQEFIVASPSMALHLPALFALETSSFVVGDTARLLVHSGIEDQLMIFEIYRDGECIRRSDLHTETNPSILEIPITEEDRGGLGLTLTLVRDNQFIQLQRNLIVPYDNKQLQVEFSTFRDRLRPGNHEKLSVRVTGPAGKDMAVPAAELLAYMYDRSLDSFVPHSYFNPINLYPFRGQSVSAQPNLGTANTIWLRSGGFNRGGTTPSFRSDRLLYYSGYGIGGVGRRALANKGMYVEDREVMLEAAPAIGTVMSAVMPEESDTAGAAIEPPTIELRSNFSETAFWEPHLITNKDGSVSFEFDVPDSVTSWNVWVHAITRDLKSGSIQREAQSVKDLMVRPYLPRFLREGDRAEIKVVVNNASDRELNGHLDLDIIDPGTDESILSEFGLLKADASGKPFTVPAGGSANLAFPVKTPSRVGQIAFKVTAVSGEFSDGELRPIPILPGRMHLMQSRFVTLKDADRRVIRFEDLARNDDPTRIDEQMVVTLEAQLFYSVLSALPYLVNYPYECTEQTLNRFVSTGILSSLYSRYPAIEKMAREFSSRETRYEQWDASDPNRKMMLEETPWLQTARGGEDSPSSLIKVLDSRVAKAQQETSLAKLRNSQTSSGGFPWFPGGPPSPYMTLYILNGFSKALEFGVDIPGDMVRSAWNYMHRHYLDEIVRDIVEHDYGLEFVTFINYVLSNYPESWYDNSFTTQERRTMLDFSFKHWPAHSPFLKGYLALTLSRMDRPQEAMLVWESVMDSAKTAQDQGTFWAPEDRAWLWYNDTIETHAFAIRTEMELKPDDPKLDGLVQWLFLNKKMNHWKSTRATAEVIYSLAHYLETTGQLGVREEADVTVGGLKTSFVFEPDTYTGGENRIILTGEKIDPETASEITVEKTGIGHMFASATWHFSTEKLPEEERGDYLQLTRKYFKRVLEGKEYTLQPLEEGAAIETADEVEVHLSLTSKHPMEYVHLRDPRGAGFEPASNLSKHKWNLGISWYEEIRDSGTNFFFEQLPQGEYTFKYRLRATTAGVFKVSPATAQPMYAPEFAAYSSGAQLEIR